MAKFKTHYEDCDILVVGGGMAGTGATFESRYWGRDMKIVCAEKAKDLILFHHFLSPRSCIHMAMAAALVAAIAEIHLKRLKLATLQCRERIGAAVLGWLISR